MINPNEREPQTITILERFCGRPLVDESGKSDWFVVRIRNKEFVARYVLSHDTWETQAQELIKYSDSHWRAEITYWSPPLASKIRCKHSGWIGYAAETGTELIPGSGEFRDMICPNCDVSEDYELARQTAW